MIRSGRRVSKVMSIRSVGLGWARVGAFGTRGKGRDGAAQPRRGAPIDGLYDLGKSQRLERPVFKRGEASSSVGDVENRERTSPREQEHHRHWSSIVEYIDAQGGSIQGKS
jgi:hypothetical protein